MIGMSRLRSLLEGGSDGTTDNIPKAARAPVLTPLEREFLPPVLEIQETPPSPIKRKILWSIVLVFAALLGWSYFGRIQVTSMVSGKLIPDGKVKVVQPFETSVVRSIHVKDGQEVHRGDLLLELDPTINGADMDEARKRLTIAREREENARPLVKIGALALQDYLKLKQDVASAQGNFIAARQRYDLEWLRSPVDGVVQGVDVTTVGAVVTPAQPLVTIVPSGTSLIVDAMLSNDDIGFVKEGQRAEIKVDTFPFQKYGTVQGTVVWISPDAEDKSTSDGQRSGNQAPRSDSRQTNADGGPYLYRIHIKPDRLTMNIDGKQVPLTAGMTVKADIVTDNRRVISFFLSPIIKYLDEGLKVR